MTVTDIAAREIRRLGIDARLALIAAAGVAGTSLAGAFVGQYAFGFEPCVLCVWQRVPFALAAAVALAALFLPLSARARAVVVLGLAAVFAVNAALAGYHVGVEEHWWGSIAACSGQDLQDLSFEAMASGAAAWKPCDEVDWRFLRLSLAGYNTLLSGGMALACAIVGGALIRRENA